jgi:GntR family transcriptional repressor for pyruvate dehydrogenase complex
MKRSKILDIFEFKKITPDRSGNMTSTVTNYLRNLILTHKLRPGFVFPRENLFCVDLGVGRSTLREAYKSLESEGLITRTKSGTYINDEAEFISFNLLSTAIQLSDIKDLIEFRAMVEVELAGLAADRATDEQIENLYQLLASMRNHREDLAVLTFYDMQFHLEIANASHNNLLITTIRSVIGVFTKSIYNAFHVDTEANVKQALQYHENILFSIQKRDRAMARNVMRSHVQSVSEYMRNAPLSNENIIYKDR